MGRGQVVRQRVLVSLFLGSNPSGPVFQDFGELSPFVGLRFRRGHYRWDG